MVLARTRRWQPAFCFISRDSVYKLLLQWFTYRSSGSPSSGRPAHPAISQIKFHVNQPHHLHLHHCSSLPITRSRCQWYTCFQFSSNSTIPSRSHCQMGLKRSHCVPANNRRQPRLCPISQSLLDTFSPSISTSVTNPARTYPFALENTKFGYLLHELALSGSLPTSSSRPSWYPRPHRCRCQ